MENPFYEFNATSPVEISYKAKDIDLSIVNMNEV